MKVRTILTAALAVAATAMATAPASAIRADASSGGRPQLDVRAGQRTPVPVAVHGARQALLRRLGIEAHLAVDPVGGGIRALDRTNGFLSGPRAGDAAAAALAWVRANAAAFGLTGAQIASLQLTSRQTSNDGVTHLTWVAERDGVPAYDSVLRVHVARDGRVLAASGPPLGGLSIETATPGLTASQALKAAQNDVGAPAALPHAATRRGPQRVTSFSNGDSARLVVFQSPGGDRLAWRVTVAGKDPYWYDEVVDASTGAVLARRSLTDFAVSNASVYDYHPGAASGGTVHAVDIGRWLSSTTTLSGPNAHAYADVNNNDTADSGEEIPPSSGTDWNYPIGFFTGVCTYCTWNESSFSTETTNRSAVTTQVFYLVNTFHDWLAQPDIGFTPAASGPSGGSGGNFEGADPVLAEADDSVFASGSKGPFFNNANMSTLPDGQSPRMQMYLFKGSLPDVDGGEDASVVYHEYTHGLSNRLIDDANGLSQNQGQAMGEGWSDWYAMDYLADPSHNYVGDTSADGEVVVGAYVTGNSVSGIRNQPLDCPVGSTDPACPGTLTSHGPGGFTYADLGRVGAYDASTPRFEVHDDGEIWSETLWDLRKALTAPVARRLVTNAMRLSPANPSFLDERDAILLADQADGGANHDAIWQVFAHRGMGYGAETTSPNATRALASFATPTLAENGGTTVDDTGANGDGDGVPEPGETLRLTLTLDNPGLTGLTNVHGTLSAVTPGVTVDQPDADYGAIDAGTGADNATPFSVAIGPSVGCGSLIELTLHATSDQGSADVPVAVALGSGDTVVASTDVPKTIVDNSPTSQAAVSTLTIPSGARIDQLRMTVDASHTWIGDLRAWLTSPSGTKVDLLERPGSAFYGSSGIDWNGPITFDDAAASSIQELPDSGSALTGGSFVPDEPLAAFAGEDSTGTWTLRMTDESRRDTGQLNGWSLDLDNPNCSFTAVPPTATTGDATSVTDTGATLNGTVDAGGAATTYRFDYGTTTAYGQRTPEASAGSGMGAVARSVGVTSLSASTTYHFHVVALRGGVPVASGADQTFTTAATPSGGGGSGGGSGGTGGGSGGSGGGSSGGTGESSGGTGGGSGGGGAVGGTAGGGGTPPAIAAPTGVTRKAAVSARGTFAFVFNAAAKLSGSVRFTIPKHGRTKAIAFGTRSFVVPSGGRVKLTIKLSSKALTQLRKRHSLKVSVTFVLGGKAFKATVRLTAPKPKPRRRR